MSTRTGHKPGQKRSAAKETTEQWWWWWDNATKESNRWDYTHVGVTNLSMVEAETAAVGLTKCRPYWRRPHRYNVEYVNAQLVSGCRRCREWRRMWSTGGRQSSEHRLRTMPWSIGRERCCTRYGEPEFTWWIQVTESTWDESTLIGKHQPARTKNEGPRRRPVAADRCRPNRSQANQTNSRLLQNEVNGLEEPSSHRDVEDDQWTARFQHSCPLHVETTTHSLCRTATRRQSHITAKHGRAWEIRC